MSNTINPDLLTVRIVSPKQEFYNGPALSVSSVNSAGKFDILPQHANFLTLVQRAPITVRPPQGQPLTFNFPLAIVYLSKNQVNIYTDIQIELGEEGEKKEIGTALGKATPPTQEPLALKTSN